MQQAKYQSDEETGIWRKEAYLAYGIVMFLILTVGFLGNVLTLLVLKKREHRRRLVSPLMINLALAGIFIILFGYPISIHVNLGGTLLKTSHCSWRGFVNGTVGITCICTLTEMSAVSYYGLRRVNRNSNITIRQGVALIGAAWSYGILCMIPPLLGWNRYVLSASRVSCCPDWAGESTADTAYNLLLIALGFLIPLITMVFYYYKMFRLVRQNFVPGNLAVQLRHRISELKIARMTAMSVFALMVSWAPYCFLSVVAIFTRDHPIENWEAEIPELLAKASVVYNPIIYTVMNNRFRATLLRILRLRRRATGPETAETHQVTCTGTQHSLRLGAFHYHDHMDRNLQVTAFRRRHSEHHNFIEWSVNQDTVVNTNPATITPL